MNELLSGLISFVIMSVISFVVGFPLCYWYLSRRR